MRRAPGLTLCCVREPHSRHASPRHRSAAVPPSPRLIRVLVPFLVLLTGGFGLWQLFLAGMHLRHASYPFALFYAVMGIAGIAIATALRRGLRTPPRPNP